MSTRAFLLRFLAAAALCFCWALAAQAQCNFVTVTGTITDPNGLLYSGATIEAQIVPASGATCQNSQGPFTGDIRASLDSTGSFSMNVAANNSISQPGTKWQFTINSGGATIPTPFGTGPQSFSTTLTINATQSLSATLSALAPSLSHASTASGLKVNGVTVTNPNLQDSSSYFYQVVGSNIQLQPQFSVVMNGIAALNGTFEAPTFDQTTATLPIPPVGWSNLGPAGAGSTQSYDLTNPPPNSAFSLKLHCTSNPGGQCSMFSNVFWGTLPGQTYTLTAYARSDGTAPAAICLNFTEGNSVVLDQQFCTQTLSTTWTLLSVSGAPTNAEDTGDINLTNNGQSAPIPGDVWFNDVQLSLAPTAPTNAQTGTAYTIKATDRYGYVSTSNAGAIAVTLPQAGTAGFGSNFFFTICDIGAGTATITPTTSTISSSNGSSYTSGAASLALTTGQCAFVYSDNTNYFAIVRGAAGGVPAGTFQTNGSNNTTSTSQNLITSTVNSAGLTATPSNPATNQEKIEITGVVVPASGGTGVASPTAHSDPQAEGASNFAFVGPGLTGQVKTANNGADPTYNSPGVPGRTVAGASDTILCDSGTAIRDRVATIQYTSGSAVAVTLPQAGSSGCGSNFAFAVKVTGAGAVTITPTTSTIDGNATLVVTQGQNCSISSPDNVNYTSRCSPGQVTAGANITVTPSANGSAIAAQPCTTTALSLQYNNAGAFGCVGDFTYNVHTLTLGASGILDLSAASVTAGFKLPTAAGAAPTADGFDSYNSTIHAQVWGSNGNTIVGAAAALGTSNSTACTNQVFTVISAVAAPTCTTLTNSFIPSGTVLWNQLGNPNSNLALTMGANTSIFNTTSALAQFFAWKNTTAATVGTSQGSPIPALCGRAWTGSDVEDCLTLSDLPGNGVNAAIQFAIGHTGTSTGGIDLSAPGTITSGTSNSAGTAGYIYLPQGSDQSGSTKCATTTICDEAPGSVTSYAKQRPGAKPTNNNSAEIYSNANPAVGSFLPVPLTAILTSQYTNSTTTFSNVTGGENLAFSLEANTKYQGTCTLYYQAAATGGLNIEFTGPASPTFVTYGLIDPGSATAIANASVATAYSTSLGAVVTTAATNFPSTVTFGISNGANAGTLQLLAKSSAAVQLQIQTGSFCTMSVVP